MPAFLQSFIEAEEERSRRIEQLRKEVREYAEEEAGSSITEQILLFLADEMVERLSEIDYELRKKFESYITPLIKQKYLYRYTGTFDRIRQSYIRVRMKTPAGQRECEWKYKNEILFVPYHSEQTIVKSVETVRCRSNMVWNFKAEASEKMKIYNTAIRNKRNMIASAYSISLSPLEIHHLFISYSKSIL